MKDNEIFLSLLDSNGTKLDSFKFPKPAGIANQVIEDKYKTLEIAQTVSPGFILHQYLEKVIREESSESEGLGFTLQDLVSKVQQ